VTWEKKVGLCVPNYKRTHIKMSLLCCNNNRVLTYIEMDLSSKLLRNIISTKSSGISRSVIIKPDENTNCLDNVIVSPSA
jgi:hypothetical protein